jgi:hypothetical protein
MTTRSNKVLALGAILLLLIATAGYVWARRRGVAGHELPVQSGDSARQPLISEQLRTLLAPEGITVPADFQQLEKSTVREMRVQWGSTVAGKVLSTEQSSGRLSVRSSRVSAGSLPRRRALALADTQVLIVGVDQSARLIWWHTMADPRVLRSETITPSGQISGQIFYQPTAEFALNFPDDPAIRQLRIYHPNWTGERFQLVLIGTIDVQ